MYLHTWGKKFRNTAEWHSFPSLEVSPARLCLDHPSSRTAKTPFSLLPTEIELHLSYWGFPCSSAGKESTFNAGEPSLIPGSERSTKGIGYPLKYSWVSLGAQLVKNPPATWETWVRSLGWEDRLEKEQGYPLQYSGLENSMDCV